MVMYLWLVKASKQTIEDVTGLNPRTVRNIINDLYQILQEDLQDNDIQIGNALKSIFFSFTYLLIQV